jgi:hypothetical protein
LSASIKTAPRVQITAPPAQDQLLSAFPARWALIFTILPRLLAELPVLWAFIRTMPHSLALDAFPLAQLVLDSPTIALLVPSGYSKTTNAWAVAL